MSTGSAIEDEAGTQPATTDWRGSDDREAPFQRAVSLLRGTRSRITFCHINFWGRVTEECGAVLHRLFGEEAMIEQVDDSTFILMFVRPADDQDCIERHVLRRLAETPQMAFDRHFRATISSSRHDSASISDSDDPLSELLARAAKGGKIVAI